MSQKCLVIKFTGGISVNVGTLIKHLIESSAYDETGRAKGYGYSVEPPSPAIATVIKIWTPHLEALSEACVKVINLLEEKLKQKIETEIYEGTC